MAIYDSDQGYFCSIQNILKLDSGNVFLRRLKQRLTLYLYFRIHERKMYFFKGCLKQIIK